MTYSSKYDQYVNRVGCVMMLGLAVAVVLIVAVVIALMATADLRSDELPVHHALQPIAGPSQHRAEQSPITGIHDAPARRFTVEEAHRAMQLHLECTVQACACKRAAWTALERAERVHPARRAARRS